MPKVNDLKCKHCGKVCGNRTGLFSHLRSKHDDHDLPPKPKGKRGKRVKRAYRPRKPKAQMLMEPANFCPKCGYCVAAVRLVGHEN